MTPDEPTDPLLRVLELHGYSATYTDEGTGEPLFVLVHGLPGSVRDYRWLEPALRDEMPGVRVVRLDMPGFGGTDVRLGRKMSIEDRARFVVSAISTLDLRDVVVMATAWAAPLRSR